MASKNNIRSMRFSNEIIEMIESQVGDTFTAKFEALVTRCMWELPRKEEQLKAIQLLIDDEQKKLEHLRETRNRFESNVRDLNWALESAQRQVKRINDALEKIET